MALLETSSLGTPAARQIRSATPADVVQDVRRRQAQHHPPQPAARADTRPGGQDKAAPGAGNGHGRPAFAGAKWLRGGIVSVAAALVIAAPAAIAPAVFNPQPAKTPPPEQFQSAVAPVPPIGAAARTQHDTLFFESGSASLPPDADSTLAPLAAQVRAQHLQVSIIGYAADGDSAVYNSALSLARAQAVHSRLVALGLPPGQITAVAGRDAYDVPPQACDRHGHLDETICAQSRQVVITLSPEYYQGP
jgi:outer membrane protein OmpA-like peptidoglycan-associated protein